MGKITKKIKPVKEGAAVRSDRVEISPQAREAKEIRSLVEAAKAMPEVRTEIIRQAEEKLADGTLVKEDTLRKAAERLADLL